MQKYWSPWICVSLIILTLISLYFRDYFELFMIGFKRFNNEKVLNSKRYSENETRFYDIAVYIDIVVNA